MSQEIRIGIIGCGKIATASHLPCFQKLSGVKIAALFDVDPRRAEKVRQEFAPNAAVFSDFAALLRSGAIDAVSICTPNHLHCAQTLGALEAGLHVLCEKPIAPTLAEGSEMIAAARRAGRILQINQSCRYAPLYIKIAELIDEGKIGRPRHVRCIRAVSDTPDVAWSPGAAWFVQKGNAGGIALDLGIHMADLMRWFMGDVQSVAALTDTWKQGVEIVDNVSALFRFKNGATGVLELSWTLPPGANLLEIYGTEGTLRTGFGGAPIELLRRRDKETFTEKIEPPASAPSSFECFVAAIRGEFPTPTPGEYGWRALALCDAILRAAASGKFENVQEYVPGE